MGYLNHQSDSFTSIATNETSLRPGYIIFVTFVLFGLTLSQILKMITGTPSRKAAPANDNPAPPQDKS